jgi:predicted nucleotidyltransferase
VTVEELTGRLIAALQGRPEVRLAFLFGSAVTRGPDLARDVDVAVAFAQPLSLLQQCALCAQLEQIVGREIDLVDLDGASTLLRWEVVRNGIALAARDRRDLVDFRARVPLEYFDLQPYLEREADGLRRALEKSRWSASTS